MQIERLGELWIGGFDVVAGEAVRPIQLCQAPGNVGVICGLKVFLLHAGCSLKDSLRIACQVGSSKKHTGWKLGPAQLRQSPTLTTRWDSGLRCEARWGALPRQRVPRVPGGS